MTRLFACVVTAALVAVTATASAAQGVTEAANAPQVGPPVRPLGAALAATTEALTSVTQVRALPGGRVLVNDATRRRLLLLDSTMALLKVVADSAPTTMNSYGPRPAKLMAYRGDSSLLLDSGSLSMLVIDGNGEIVKVRAIPRTEHATYIASTGVTYGNPGFDAMGRLVYRIFDPVRYVTVAAGGGIMVPEQPDSSAILRMDLESRKIDTVGLVKLQKRITEATRMASGGITSRTMTNPMPVQDDWAVMKDGSVAFLRHRDYSIDWVNPDGSRTSTPPMPFSWQRLTDDHKRAFVDSVKTALEASRASMVARYDSINYACFTAPRTEQPAAQPPARGPAAAAPVPACPPSPYPTASMFGTVTSVIPWSAMPDYKPPFANNSTRTDDDNNLWIRVNQMQPVPGTFLYDVVNRRGELFDRIQIPTTRTLVGFAPGGVAYVTAREGNVLRLERVRWTQR